MKNLQDLQKAVIEKAAAGRPQDISEDDVAAFLGVSDEKSAKLGDVLYLANLDVEALREGNKSSANFISKEVEKAEMLIKIKKNVPVYEALLREMIENNRNGGVLTDTPEIAELRIAIDAAKGLHVGEEVDEAALEVINFRQLYKEIQDAADVVRNLLKGTKEEADAAVDGLVDKYHNFFGRLWKGRHVQEVPSNLLNDWRKKKVSFSDYAFSAKNHEGKRIWAWGIKGDEKSMAIAKSMRRFYADLDVLLFRLKKAERPAPSSTPVPAPVPEHE